MHSDKREPSNGSGSLRIVVIGASAGGVEAITRLASQFSRDINAAIFVVLHMPHNARSLMPQILQRAGDLEAIAAEPDQQIRAGVIYVAPPDRHVIVRMDHAVTVFGPRENGHRPAVDPLFRSAAEAYGNRVIAVVLSGNLDDGTAGLAAVKACGGVAIVQDPDEALHSGMPRSAIDNVTVDYVLPLDEIVPTIVRLLASSAPEQENGMSESLKKEIRSAQLDPDLADSDDHPGDPSGFSCPECNGVLWEVKDAKLMRFRCRVGHAYSADSLASAAGSAVEAALWAALRSLEENAAFARRLAKRAEGMSQSHVSERFSSQAARATEHAVTLRHILLSGPIAAEPQPEKLIAPEAVSELTYRG